MSKPNEPERVPHLILELSSGTAIIDGDRFELPQKEFQVLVELAAHAGEVVAKADLIEAVWPDVPGMTNNDLYTQLSRLRKRIKDGKGRPALIRNRPRFGYSLDLPPENIQVVGVTPSEDREPTEPTLPSDAATPVFAPVLTADEREPEDVAIPVLRVGPQEDERAEEASAEGLTRVRRRSPLRPGAVLVAALLASLTVGGSWFAGYLISQRRSDAVAEGASRHTPEATPSAATEGGPKTTRKKGATANEDRGKGGGGSGSSGEPGDQVAGTFITSPGSGGQKSSEATNSPGGAQKPKPPPPPPQPDAQLFHLHHPDSGDRYMTISSSAANQKQAAGYSLSSEGRVFTTQVNGTIAITLHDGSAYVYRARDAVPDGVSVTELYRLTKSGAFFYTKSSSSANQAEAQGWSRSVAGFVQ